MIVAIINQTLPTGIVFVEEFRVANDEAAALESFGPTTPSDWLAVDTGWESLQRPTPGARWAYDFDAAQVVQSPTVLEQSKSNKCAVVDRRTAELVTSGFDHNSRTFSTSEVAQKNLSELNAVKSVIQYPFLMATKDNSEIYPIESAEEVAQMYSTALSTIISRYQSGNLLKQQAIAAGTLEELEAVVDNR